MNVQNCPCDIKTDERHERFGTERLRFKNERITLLKRMNQRHDFPGKDFQQKYSYLILKEILMLEFDLF